MPKKQEKKIKIDPNKIKIDPATYPDVAKDILKMIADMVDAKETQYEIVPAADRSHAFISICGKLKEHSFTVEHFVPDLRSEKDELIVSFDDWTFSLAWEDMRLGLDIVTKIDNFIKETYAYDENSNRYVPKIKREKIDGLDKCYNFIMKLKTFRKKTK